MNASLLAGLAFGYADVASIHSIGEVVGGLYPIPHGVLSAIFLPEVCEYCKDSAIEKYVDLAKMSGIKTDGLTSEKIVENFIKEIRQLQLNLQIPHLKDYDICTNDFELISKRCVEHACNADNPLVLNENDFTKILEFAYNQN